MKEKIALVISIIFWFCLGMGLGFIVEILGVPIFEDPYTAAHETLRFLVFFIISPMLAWRVYHWVVSGQFNGNIPKESHTQWLFWLAGLTAYSLLLILLYRARIPELLELIIVLGFGAGLLFFSWLQSLKAQDRQSTLESNGGGDFGFKRAAPEVADWDVFYAHVKATDDFNLSFISFRKNVTGQFNELIEHYYIARSAEALEIAIHDKSALLPIQFEESVGGCILYSLERFLDECNEFSKEKGYWGKDARTNFDQITAHASAWLTLMGVDENVNDTKFLLFQLVVLTFALKAHNDPLLKEEMGIKEENY